MLQINNIICMSPAWVGCPTIHVHCKHNAVGVSTVAAEGVDAPVDPSEIPNPSQPTHVYYLISWRSIGRPASADWVRRMHCKRKIARRYDFSGTCISREKKNTAYNMHLLLGGSMGGGKLACAGGGGGVVGAPFPDPPPLLGSRDGALKKVIDGCK